MILRDGDMDYCRSDPDGGIWDDCGPQCKNNECCKAGEVCNTATHDCVPDNCDTDATACISICGGKYYDDAGTYSSET